MNITSANYWAIDSPFSEAPSASQEPEVEEVGSDIASDGNEEPMTVEWIEELAGSITKVSPEELVLRTDFDEEESRKFVRLFQGFEELPTPFNIHKFVEKVSRVERRCTE